MGINILSNNELVQFEVTRSVKRPKTCERKFGVIGFFYKSYNKLCRKINNLLQSILLIK